MFLRKDIIQLIDVGYQVNNQGEPLVILKDIQFHIKSGTSVAISGPSGSGKTTLLNLMAGLDLPTQGQILYAGQDITTMSEDGRAELRAKGIGFIFQSFQLLNNLNALENVMLPLEINRQEQAQEQASLWLERVGLAHRMYHYPFQLSGGEQQRVAIARAFSISPHVLFADEPTGNLDIKTGEKITNLLFSLNQDQRTTLVIVTHDESLANRCEVHFRLLDGRLTC